MNPYYEQKILSSEPVELIRIVYQRAIASVREAREHLHQKRVAERSAAIMRAYAAIAQLICALDSEVAPDLCNRLGSLYAYIQRLLLDANLQQADPPLVEVMSLLTTLAEAWSVVASEASAEERQAKAGRWPSANPSHPLPSYAVSA